MIDQKLNLLLFLPKKEAAASRRIKHDQFSTPSEALNTGEPIATSELADD